MKLPQRIKNPKTGRKILTRTQHGKRVLEQYYARSFKTNRYILKEGYYYKRQRKDFDENINKYIDDQKKALEADIKLYEKQKLKIDKLFEKKKKKKKKKRLYQVQLSIYRKVDKDDIANHKMAKNKRYTTVNGIKYRQASRMILHISNNPTPWENDYIVKYDNKNNKPEPGVQYTDDWKLTAHTFGILQEDEKWEYYYDQYYDYVDMIRMYDIKSHVIEIEQAKKEKLFDIRDKKLFEGGATYQMKIMSKYIDYDLNKQAEKFNDLFCLDVVTDYVQDNYHANSCFANAIVDEYYMAFSKKKKNGKRYYAELTYDRFCHIIDLQNKKQNLGLSINNSLKFFKKFNLGLDVINIFGEALTSYRPAKLNTVIRPQVMRILVHNNHCYRLNSKIKSLSQTIDKMTWEEMTALNVSDRYHIRKTDVTVKNHCIECLDDVVSVLKENNDETEYLRFIYRYDIEDILFDCIQSNYVPQVRYEAGKLLGLSFKVGKTKCSIQLPDTTAPEDNDIEIEPEHLDKYIEIDNNFYEKIAKPEYMSEFPEDVLNIEQNYYMNASAGYFDEYDNSMVYNGIDMRKAYSVCLHDITTIPVFDYFDRYVKWQEGDTIRPHDVYVIGRENNSQKQSIIFDKKYNRCFGFKLLYAQKQGIKCTIHYVRRYSRLETVNYGDIVDELYNEKDFPIKCKKHIANKTTGLLEKKKNKSYACKLFNNFAEAQYYQIKYGGGDIIILGDDDATMGGLFANKKKRGRAYMLVFKKDKVLTNGFRYIKEMIYNMMNMKMYELYKKCHKGGLKVIGIKTDCLVVQNSRSEIEQTGYVDFADKFGGWKFEAGNDCVNHRMGQDKNKLCELETTKVNEIEIKDEYDTSEFKKIFDKHNRILVKGVLPGVGKTTAVKNYGGKTLFVTPFNKLASEIRRSGHNVTTVNKLLGIFGDGREYRKMKPMDVGAFENICFDEVYMNSPSYLRKIDRFICQHPDIKFLATGDLNQLDPIGYEGNGAYYDACINYVFPNQITLKINKRVKTEKQRKTLTKLKRDIFNPKKDIMDIFKKYDFKIIDKMSDIKTRNNICYFNYRVDRVNKHVQNNLIKIPKKSVKINGIHYYKGLDLICRKHYSSSKGLRFFVNYTYNILDINKKNFTICDEFEGHTYFKLNIKLINHFKLGYASTIHSCQGLSIDEKITIFDSNTVYSEPKAVWTAITRATDLNNITIFRHSDAEKNTLYRSKLRQYFELKIGGYKTQDKKANREFKDDEFITVTWLANEFEKSQKCGHCKKQFERYIDKNNHVISNITVDRIDNVKPHIMSNCVLRCLECNVKRSNHY